MFVYDWDQILVIAVILFTFKRTLLRYKFSQLINMISWKVWKLKTTKLIHVSPLLQTCIGFSIDPDANHHKLSLG